MVTLTSGYTLLLRPLLILSAFTWMLLSSGCNCGSDAVSVDCEQLVERILVLQDKRKARNAEANRLFLQYEEGRHERSKEEDELKRPKMLEHKEKWQARESVMREEVSVLYAEARAKHCL